MDVASKHFLFIYTTGLSRHSQANTACNTLVAFSWYWDFLLVKCQRLSKASASDFNSLGWDKRFLLGGNVKALLKM